MPGSTIVILREYLKLYTTANETKGIEIINRTLRHESYLETVPSQRLSWSQHKAARSALGPRSLFNPTAGSVARTPTPHSKHKGNSCVH